MTNTFFLTQGSRNPSRYSEGHTVPSLQGSIYFLTEHQKGKTDQTMNKVTELPSQPRPVPWPDQSHDGELLQHFCCNHGTGRCLRLSYLMPLTLKWGITDFNLGLPWWVSGKESAYNTGVSGSIPGSGRSPGAGNGDPLQYSCLGNPMDRS